MLEPKLFDELVRRISDGLPAGIKDMQQDLEKNIRATISGALDKMDVVTREEFDIQKEVLARSRARLEVLEKLVADLEATLRNTSSSEKSDS